jgi:hypothetical protein
MQGPPHINNNLPLASGAQIVNNVPHGIVNNSFDVSTIFRTPRFWASTQSHPPRLLTIRVI